MIGGAIHRDVVAPTSIVIRLCRDLPAVRLGDLALPHYASSVVRWTEDTDGKCEDSPYDAPNFQKGLSTATIQH